MKKLTFSTLIFLVPAIAAIVPYWTSLEVKRQVGDFNQTFYQTTDLKMLDSTYQRGWFHSVAQSNFEGKEQATDKSVRFILLHDIDHAFVPIQPTMVHTRIYPANINDEEAEIDEKVALLEVHTAVQTNGDSLSRVNASPLKDSDENFKYLVSLLWKKFFPNLNLTEYFPPEISTLHVKDNNLNLQWQGLQGTVAVEQNAGTLQTEMHSPKIQLDTVQGKIVIRGITVNADMQLVNADVMKGSVNIAEIQLTDVTPAKSVIQNVTFNIQSSHTAMQGSLNIAAVQLIRGEKIRTVKLEGIKLIGHNNIIDEYLTVAIKTNWEQIQMGTDHYGPGYGDFEIRHWHLPTLAKIPLQDLTQVQQANPSKIKLMSLGLTLLNKSPEFALTRLNFNTPDGELRGKLQVKMEPFKGGIFAFFINPFLLVNALNAKLEADIPQPLLDRFIQNNEIDNKIRQRLKTWKRQGILIPTDDQPGYYRSQMQLSDGILQVNGQQLPLATIWNENI